MGRTLREIVIIDENLCDGCGDCILTCDEGAIQIIDGIAKLVSENLCDGFGNCLGSCPQDAITIEKQEVDDFDETAVEKHLAALNAENQASSEKAPVESKAAPTAAFAQVQSPAGAGGGCPGSAMRHFNAPPVEKADTAGSGELPSTLGHWPVQLMLVPPTAPFLKGKELLLTADCCPFAYADFHRRYLAGKSLLIGCPKLDDLSFYQEKLTSVFRDSGCTGVTVMIMEVPCCGGLKSAAIEALKESGADIPMTEIVVGVQGDILRETSLN